MKISIVARAVASTSAVAPESEYSWNTYTSVAGMGLVFRGKEVMIATDTQFGLRDGTKGAARLILRGEPTKVITVTPEERTVLLARSTPVTTKGGKKAKVQGVVPKFDAAASWKNEVAPALKEAAATVAGTSVPTIQVITFLEKVYFKLNDISDGGATAVAVKDLVGLLAKPPVGTGTLNSSKENVRLAMQLLESSPEWKRIRTGKLKLSKFENAYSIGQDFYYASVHMGIAKALVAGNREKLRRDLDNLDTSARESFPSKLYGQIKAWAMQGVKFR